MIDDTTTKEYRNANQARNKCVSKPQLVQLNRTTQYVNMGNSLLPKLEAFIELISSLLEDVTLPKHERLEYSKLKQFLEDFALVVIDKLTLEESPINLARSLFVQIYRMSLTRSRRAVFPEKADEIEREASKSPYTVSLYLNETQLWEIADIVKSEMFTRYRYGIADEDRPLERIHEQLKTLLRKLHYS